MSFGPRVPGTAAHKACGDYLSAKLAGFGADAGDAGYFLECEQLRLRSEVDSLLGHAIHAAKITPIGDADAEIGDFPRELVLQHYSLYLNTEE